MLHDISGRAAPHYAPYDALYADTAATPLTGRPAEIEKPRAGDEIISALGLAAFVGIVALMIGGGVLGFSL